MNRLIPTEILGLYKQLGMRPVQGAFRPSTLDGHPNGCCGLGMYCHAHAITPDVVCGMTSSIAYSIPDFSCMYLAGYWMKFDDNKHNYTDLQNEEYKLGVKDAADLCNLLDIEYPCWKAMRSQQASYWEEKHHEIAKVFEPLVYQNVDEQSRGILPAVSGDGSPRSPAADATDECRVGL
jgi:hypothetical protein